MTSLVDTNILVYRHDPRFPTKQAIARGLLLQGLADQDLVLPHQSLIEFVVATTRPRSDLEGAPLLTAGEAGREAESLLREFPVVYPDRELVVTDPR